MIFKKKCCRCGFCCLVEVCGPALEVHKIDYEDRFTVTCPSLHFDGTGEATCQVAALSKLHAQMMGVGAGCCIGARAMVDGREYDFAILDDMTKYKIVREYRQKKLLVVKKLKREGKL